MDARTSCRIMHLGGSNTKHEGEAVYPTRWTPGHVNHGTDQLVCPVLIGQPGFGVNRMGKV